MTSPVPASRIPEAVHRRRWAILGVLMLSLLIVVLDNSILNVAIKTISTPAPTGLGATQSQIEWAINAYTLVFAGLLFTAGLVGDRLGRKKVLLGGLLVFGVGSALAAESGSPGQLIAFRALMALGAAFVMPATLAVLMNVFEREEQPKAIGIWAGGVGLAIAIGPITGGALLDHFWWGSVFLINLPVMAVLVLVGIRTLPESRNPNPGPWDLISVVLSLIGMIALVYAVKEAATHGFTWPTLATALLGATALYGFVRRQLTMPAPLLDMRLFRRRGFSGAVLADLLTVLGMSGLVFFLSQYLQLVQGRRPFEAGLAELPAAVGAVAAGLVAGRAARRFSVRAVVSGGLAAVGIALAVLTTVGRSTGYPVLGAALLVVGIGAGLSFTVTADVILSSVPKDEAGAASAVSETAYELGAALGIALLGSIVTGVYRDFPGPAGTPAGAHESLGAAVEASASLPPHTAQALLDAARGSFVHGLQLASGAGAAVLLTTALVAWFLLKGQKLESAG